MGTMGKETVVTSTAMFVATLVKMVAIVQTEAATVCGEEVLLVAMEEEFGATCLATLVDTVEMVVALAVGDYGHLVLVEAMAVMEVPTPALFLGV